MLQQDEPKDYVIATGVQYTLGEFVEAVGNELGMNITWKREGLDETGVDQNGNIIVRIDSRYFRPSEVETLLEIQV